jgi:transcriptional regulator with XRE-family HTH domain
VYKGKTLFRSIISGIENDKTNIGFITIAKLAEALVVEMFELFKTTSSYGIKFVRTFHVHIYPSF